MTTTSTATSGFKLKPFQLNAKDRILEKFKDHCAVLLSAGTGVGKTIISCAVAREYIDSLAASPISALASPKVLVITPKSVKFQFALDAKGFFGLHKASDIEFVSPGELRNSKGTTWLEQVPNEDPKEVTSGRTTRYRWRTMTPPLLVIVDECQWTNNVGTQQHEIMMEGLSMHEPSPIYVAIDAANARGTKFIFMSATPASKACHLDVIIRARCLDGDKPLYNRDTKAIVRQSLCEKSVYRKNLLGKTLIQGICGGADAFDVNDRAMKRASDFINDITHRVPAIRFAHKNVLNVKTMTPSSEVKANIDKALADYTAECQKLGKRNGLASRGNGKLVAMLKLRMRCEMEHAEYLASVAAYDIKVRNRQALVAADFKSTIARVALHLIRDHGFKQSDISLIWGGTDDFELGDQVYTQDEIIDVMRRGFAGEAIDETMLHAMLNQVKAMHSGMLEDIQAIQSLGIDLRADTEEETQEQIDNYQCGKAKVALMSFKKGSIGLSLNHSMKYFLMRPDEYYEPIEDPSSPHGMRVSMRNGLPVEVLPLPRSVHIAPVWSPRNFVQCIGRGHRIDSISATDQTCCLWSGTIEMAVARKLGGHLKSMSTLIKTKESWLDFLEAKEFGGYSNEQLSFSNVQEDIEEDEETED